MVWKPISRVDALKIEGIAYFDSGNYKNALLCFIDALNIDSTDYDLYYYRGCTFLKFDLYEDAIEDLDYYIFIFPEDKNALYNRGLAKFFNTKKDEAYYDFQAAADLGDSRAKSILRRLY